MQNNENDPFQPALDQPVDDSILKSSDDEHAQGRFLDGFHAAEHRDPASADGAQSVETQEASDSAASQTSVDAAPSAKPANEKDAKKLAKQQAKAAKKAASATKVHQFTISLPVIVLFVLALAGIGGTVYFAAQNSDNSSKLSDAKAQIAQLKDKVGTSTSSSAESHGQFSSLQDKISAQTKQIADAQNQLKAAQQNLKDVTDKYNTANAAATNNKSVVDSFNALIGSCSVSGAPGGQNWTCSAASNQAGGKPGITVQVKQQ